MVEVGKFYLVKVGKEEFGVWICATNPNKKLALAERCLGDTTRRFWVDWSLLHEVPEILVEVVKAEFAKLPQILPPRS